MKHPLLNPNSVHYQIEGEKPAIQVLEETLTLKEAIGFAKGNIFKYGYRLEHKGQERSDKEKLKTYQAYLEFLKWLSSMEREAPYTILHLPIINIYSVLDIDMDYTL